MSSLPSSAYADNKTDDRIEKCSAISDDATRLACFDKLSDKRPAATASGKADYREVDLSDLKVDKEHMIGERIRVRAQIQIMGDMGFLKSEMMDMTPLYFTFNRLPREQRKAIIEHCTVPCDAIVYGRVANAPLGITVVGENTELQ